MNLKTNIKRVLVASCIAFVFVLCFASTADAIATQEVDIVYANDDEYNRDPTRLFLPDVALPNGTSSSGKDVGLVVMLHGRCMDGNSIDQLIDLKKHVDTREFILAVPEGHRQKFWCSTCSRSDGILNTRYGCRTWAATDACCASAGPLRATLVRDAWEPYDDVTHIYQLIAAVKSQYEIDPTRVFVLGFENGGFMAHRMACEHPEMLSGIVSISGSSFLNASMCEVLNTVSSSVPSNSFVNVLQISGRLDRVPSVNGGNFEGVDIPSIQTVAERWASRNGCQTEESVVVDGALNLRTKLFANAPDTFSETWTNGTCQEGTVVENWVIDGMNTDTAVANSFTDTFSTALVDWMMNHTKPTSDAADKADNDTVAVQSGPSSSEDDASFGDVAIIDTSTALDGRSFEACPSDFLQCEDGSFTSRVLPSCKFFCNGEVVDTDGVFCLSSDCCGTSKTICAETSACKDTVCEEDKESSSAASVSTFFALVVVALGLLI
ncbi:unnamed protein product [Bathycoccus prasinos]